MLEMNRPHNYDSRRGVVRTLLIATQSLLHSLDTPSLKPEQAVRLLETLPDIVDACKSALSERFFDSPYPTGQDDSGASAIVPDPYETLMTLLPPAMHLVELCRRRIEGRNPGWKEQLDVFASVVDRHTLVFCQMADFRALRRYEADHAHWVPSRAAYATSPPYGQNWRASGSPPWAKAQMGKALARGPDPADHNGFVAFRGVASMLRNVELTPVWEVDIPEYGVNSVHGDSCLVDQIRKLRQTWWNRERAVVFATDLVEDRLRNFPDCAARETGLALTDFLRSNPGADGRHLIPDDFTNVGGPYVVLHYAVVQLAEVAVAARGFGAQRLGPYDPVRLLAQRFRIAAMKEGKDAYRDELDSQCARLSGCL